MPNPSPALPGSAEYDVGSGYDEAFEAPGRLRPAYEAVFSRLAGRDLDALTASLNDLLTERDVTFTGEDPHAFRVDPIPRILSAAEWADLTAGLAQRMRALDAFVADLYGERRVVAEGIIPERVVAGTSYFERDLKDTALPGAWVTLAGLDVVRDAEGRFRVLEDNLRTPSGLAYALAAATALADVLGLEHDDDDVRATLRSALRGCMEAAAPDVEGELVLLSDGPQNAAWYDHQALASIADLELVGAEDLRRRGDRLELNDGRRVRAVYRRTDQDEVRTPSGELTPLAELMLEPLRSGQLGMVSRYGAGAADDKFVYAYVDDLVRFYLEEEPTVRSVQTYDVLDQARREEALDRVRELVVKPRDGQGGQGVVVGPTATDEELDAARAAIVSAPEDWIVQEVVMLSTHPTVVDGRLEPRHVDLRPFVLYDGTDVTVPRVGLTRVALEEGSMVVNSSRAGGAKATWVTD